MTTTTSKFPTTVRALLEHPQWDSFIESKLGNDLFINDPDRAARIHDAAENGADGSTHAETIEDWREFAQTLESETRPETEEDEAARQIDVDALAADIDACEAWHEQNGSLHHEIG